MFKRSNLVFQKIYNAEYDVIFITFTDQNGRPLEIEDKVNLTLLSNKQKYHDIIQNQYQENMSKDMDFYHLQETMKTITGNGVDAVKFVFKKVFH